MTFTLASRTLRVLTGVIFLAAPWVSVQAQHLPQLEPLMRAPQADQPIHLIATNIKAEVAGTLSTTQITLTFLNPNPRQLEGELQFPLQDGQSVTGFALESLDGQMMPAVAVGKARGQEVFEAIERRSADPALLEQTLDNFKLRIYPLLPGKPSRVSLEISAQFYGHQRQVLSPDTTLMLCLSTGYGTATQKDENITLWLSGQKEEVLVGSFEGCPRCHAVSATS